MEPPAWHLHHDLFRSQSREPRIKTESLLSVITNTSWMLSLSAKVEAFHHFYLYFVVFCCLHRSLILISFLFGIPSIDTWHWLPRRCLVNPRRLVASRENHRCERSLCIWYLGVEVGLLLLLEGFFRCLCLSFFLSSVEGHEKMVRLNRWVIYSCCCFFSDF